MEKARIDSEEIKELVRKRDNENPDEFLVIEDKEIVSLYGIDCKNIIFKNCSFSAVEWGTLFSDSCFENIIIEDCSWYDSKVKNTVFKNMTIRRSIIHNNVSIVDCVFDDFKFVDSLIGSFGFSNCEFKNTDFRGCEYFFLQPTSLQFIEDLYYSGKLHDFSNILKLSNNKFVVAWYNMKYSNCVIDLESIKRLASYSDRLDPNYSSEAYGAYRTGFINLENVDEATKYNLIASTFLYDAHQVYDYLGEFSNEQYAEYFRTVREKNIPPMFFHDDKVDLSKYMKTLSTRQKDQAMTIVDSEGKEIDYSLIVPLGDITFTNNFYKDTNFVESHYDAAEFSRNSSNGNKVYQKSLWQE